MKRYNPRKEVSLARITSGRKVKQSFLIITEGMCTEPAYFKAFRVASARVKAVGKGLNTISLVNEAITCRDLERRRGITYDQCWVVFDKDDYPAKNFNEAIRFARSKGFKVAYSNQAIEFWFLLHFNLYRGQIHRDRYGEMLSKLMGIEYTKDSRFVETIYNRLINGQAEAIRRSKSIIDELSQVSPAQAESSTTVHLLVEELNKYL